MSLFALSKPAQPPTSPTWSVYDEQWNGDEQHLTAEALAGVPNTPSTSNQCSAFISYPPYTATLKGGGLKKKAPIRRGAQGAVYAAYDTSPAALREVLRESSQQDGAGQGSASASSSAESQTQLPVAVKRIFIQSNDFGAHDISATVLREVTIHRFVCAQQDKAHAIVCGASSPSGAAAAAPSDVAPRRSSLVDATARVLRLHRILEAPHKEMCLVLELAASNLERLLAPPAGHKAGGGGVQRKKPGTVALFGGSVDGSGGDACGLRVPRLEGGDGWRCAMASAAPISARCPLLSQMPLVRYLMRRLLRLVCFLHEECGVVHRDLKPSNVLVAEDGGLRLGDFGSARFAPPPAAPSAKMAGVVNTGAAASTAKEPLECTPPSMRTTLHYRPPEVLFGDQSCRPAADVWALGVMFAQLLLQKNLFHAVSELDLLGAIQKLLGMPAKTPSWIKPISPATPDRAGSPTEAPFVLATAVQASLPHKLHAGVVAMDGLDLVTRMLNQLPEYRLTIREAMAHPFLNPGGVDAAARTEEDDKAGAALWREKVAQVLHREAADATSQKGAGGFGVARPMLLGLDDDDDEEDFGENGHGGFAPFRLDLSGGNASPP